MIADKKIVIIGAGLCGLTPAYCLQQAGYSVQVLERHTKPGGLVQTFEKKQIYFRYLRRRSHQWPHRIPGSGRRIGYGTQDDPGYYRKAAKDYAALPANSPIPLACDVFTQPGQNTAVAFGNRATTNIQNYLSNIV